MATTLRNTLNQMATQFANGVMNAIRAASLEEILAETGGVGGARAPGRPARALVLDGIGRRGSKGRLERRSAEDIAALVDRIVSLLASKPKGLRAEQIREELGLEAKELPRPIAEALASKRVSKSGQKRATTYFAKGGGRGAGKARKAKATSGRRRRRAGGRKKASPGAPKTLNGASA